MPSFLKSVLNKEVGLRTGKPLSHVCVFEIEGIDVYDGSVYVGVNSGGISDALYRIKDM